MAITVELPISQSAFVLWLDSQGEETIVGVSGTASQNPICRFLAAQHPDLIFLARPTAEPPALWVVSASEGAGVDLAQLPGWDPWPLALLVALRERVPAPVRGVTLAPVTAQTCAHQLAVLLGWR
jgi:hypothetical protein